jgi:sulfite reductase alpha subunit-like flavoprotein
MVTVLSNVLRMNSAQDHRDLARAIHGMLLHDHPVQPPGPGELPQSATYGEGFIGYEAERQAVRLKLDTQEALLGLGYEIGDIDGIIGANTRKAIKDFQQTQGLKADGKTSEKLVQQMRKVAQEKGLIRADTVRQ